MNFHLKMTILQKFGNQANFAMVVGLSESSLSRIVRGRKQPDQELRENIANLLGVPEREIFPI
jgi:transcriptional regulator with XRE-family HTH domain